METWQIMLLLATSGLLVVNSLLLLGDYSRRINQLLSETQALRLECQELQDAQRRLRENQSNLRGVAQKLVAYDDLPADIQAEVRVSLSKLLGEIKKGDH